MHSTLIERRSRTHLGRLCHGNGRVLIRELRGLRHRAGNVRHPLPLKSSW